MAAVSLSTVAAFESVGAILVVAFLVGPAATAFLLTGFPADFKIRYNDKEIDSPAKVQTDGKNWLVVPLDPALPVRTGAEIETIWKLFADTKAAKVSADPASLFVHLDFAGPFPEAEGIYGPEKSLDNSVTREDTYPGEGQDGADVVWKNFGWGLPMPGIPPFTDMGGMGLFHHHHADWADTADAARHERRAGHDQRVDRVTIIGERVRDKAIIGRVPHGGVEDAVDEQRARRLVEFIFHRFAAQRAFDHHVDIVRRGNPDRNGIDTHGNESPVCSRRVKGLRPISPCPK
jgi:hypothetical protein